MHILANSGPRNGAGILLSNAGNCCHAIPISSSEARMSRGRPREREIESPGIPLIRKLASGKVNIDYKQRSAVARLIGLQNVRVPYERSFMDENNVDNLRSYIDEMDEMSRRLNAPVNAIDVAITLHDDPRLIKNWSRFTRAQILAELKEAEDDPHKSSRDRFFSLAADLEKWASTNTGKGWKEWVSGQTLISKNWLSRYVGKGDLVVPVKSVRGRP